MDSPTGRPSPRRELQGPRPTPLKVRKDSYKISKKPPIPPNNSNPVLPPLPRPPVIIYTVSPKIIHTNPSDFMTLVQRLTGPNSSDPSSAALPSPSAALSPAARFAAIEKSSSNSSPRNHNNYNPSNLIEIDADSEMMLDRYSNSIPGILSPLPSSLPPISPGFFSPSLLDPGSLSFLHDLSPGPGFNGTYNNHVSSNNNNFLVSPNNLLATPVVPSPGAYWDLFNQFPDF